MSTFTIPLNNLVSKYSVRNIFVGRYILMPDHVHLFVKLPPPSENLSAWIKSFKNYLSKALRSRKVSAPHWQKGFLTMCCVRLNHIRTSGCIWSKIPYTLV